MIAEAPTTEPTTLVEVAERLDEHRAAIDAIRREQDAERIAAMASLERQQATYLADIASHEEAARGLLAAQERLTRDSFRSLFPATTTPKRQRGTRPANGAVLPNIAARKRNAAIRRFAAEKGLDCPATGNEFSQELRDTFDRESGYQG